MLTKEQTEGLSDLLDFVRGCEESDNRSRLSAMKKSMALMLENELTAKQRAVFFMLYGEKLSQREIAARLGIGETAVSNLKHRALTRLHQIARYAVN